MKSLTRSQQAVAFQKEIWKIIRRFGAEFDLEFVDVIAILEMTKLDIYRLEVDKMNRRQR